MIENKSHGIGKNAEGGKKGIFQVCWRWAWDVSCSCLHDYRGLGNGFQGQILGLISSFSRTKSTCFSMSAVLRMVLKILPHAKLLKNGPGGQQKKF